MAIADFAHEYGLNKPINPTIFGKILDWNKVREETLNNTPAYLRNSSVFSQQDGTIYREIQAKATNTEVKLSIKDNPYIFFISRIIHTNSGHTMMEYDVQLKYPPEAGEILNGTRAKGMPHFSELTPGVKAYFESLGYKIDGIHSEWEEESADYHSSNYSKYMNAKGNGPHSPELAKKTPAGENAQDLGFIGPATIRNGFRGKRGNIPCLIADFYRPVIKINQD